MTECEKHGNENEITNQFVGRGWLIGDAVARGERISVNVDNPPRKTSRCAKDVAIDDVADASECLPHCSKNRGSVEHAPKRDLLAAAHVPERQEDGANCTVKGHAPFPSSDDAPRLGDKWPEWLLNYVI